ncbi:hypothetical protein D3C76_1812500 [compost metagenome]
MGGLDFLHKSLIRPVADINDPDLVVLPVKSAKRCLIIQYKVMRTDQMLLTRSKFRVISVRFAAVGLGVYAFQTWA